MKRTGPPQRRTELKRTTPLRANSAASKKEAKRSISPASPAQRANRDKYDYRAFCEAIAHMDGETCWLRALLVARPVDYSPGLLVCDGRLDGHHLLRKNRLKQELRGGPAPLSDEVLAEVLADPRNGVLVCRKHHDYLERGSVVLHREDLPRRAFDFAREHGLERWLDRYYRPAGPRRVTSSWRQFVQGLSDQDATELACALAWRAAEKPLPEKRFTGRESPGHDPHAKREVQKARGR